MGSSLVVVTLITASLSTTIAAASNGSPFLATFDTLPQVDSGGTAHVPTPYVGLNWSNCYVASDDNSVLLPPHSGSAATIGQLPTDPPSTISVEGIGSKVRSFTLTSTYLACLGQYSIPYACTIRFRGFKARYTGTSPSPAVTKDCAYSGGGKMELCTTAPDLTDLGFVGVQIVGQKKGDEPFRVVQLDDVRGLTYE